MFVEHVLKIKKGKKCFYYDVFWTTKQIHSWNETFKASFTTSRKYDKGEKRPQILIMLCQNHCPHLSAITMTMENFHQCA